MTIQSLCEAFLSAGLSNVGLASLLMIVAIVACRVCKSPAVVSALWVLVFLKLITPPLVTISTGMHLWPKAELPALQCEVAFDPNSSVNRPRVATELVKSRLPEDIAIDDELVRPIVEIKSAPVHDTVSDTIEVATTAQSVNDAARRSPTIERPILTQIVRRALSSIQWSKVALMIVGCWLIGSVFLASVVAARLLRFRQLIRRCKPTPTWIVDYVSVVAATVGLRSVPRVQTVECQLAPSVGCWGFKPTIVLPHQFFLSLDPVERQSLIAHELAHIVRNDHWRAWLELAGVILFWWFPPVWFARRESRRITEICCDHWVLNWFPDSAVEYVETLIKSVDFVSSTGQGMPAIIHGMGEFSNMKRRIVTIFGGRRKPQLSLSQRGMVGILALATLLFGLSWGPTSIVSQELNAQDEPTRQAEVLPVVPRTTPKVGDRVFVIEAAEVSSSDELVWKVDRGQYFKVESIADSTLTVTGDSKSGISGIGGSIRTSSVAKATDAIDIFTEQIRLNPNDAMAYMARGLVETLDQDPNAALEDLDKSIRLNPHHALTYALRSRAWSQKKLTQKAIDDCTEAIRLDPNCELAYELRMGAQMLALADDTLADVDLDQAKRDAEVVARLRPNDAGVAAMVFGLRQVSSQRKQYEERINKLTEKIESIPITRTEGDIRSVIPFLQRGETYLEQNDYDRAMADFSRALQYNSNSVNEHKIVKVLHGRGKVRLKKRDYDNSIADFSQIIELKPSDEEAYCQRGRCYFRLKNYDAAMADFDEAVRLNAKSKSAYYDRGLVWLQKGNEDRAFEDFSLAIQYPLNEAKFSIGFGTRNAFHAAAEVGSKPQAAAYSQRGKLYVKRQEFDKAKDDFEAAIKKAPKDIEGNTQLAWLLAACPKENLRDGEKAVEIARAACKESHYEAADTIQSLASAYAEAGNFKKAIEYQQKAGKLYGDQTPADWKLRQNLYLASQPYRLTPTQIAERNPISELK